MKSSLKLNLLFSDRVGIVADLSALLARGGLNIVSMEVERKENAADIYLEAESEGGRLDRHKVFEMLSGIPDLRSIKYIDTLPREKRENTFQVVLDNVSDGILSVDPDGRITTINKVAKEILGCGEKTVEGRTIKDLGLPDLTLAECLEGASFTNEKRNIITDKGRFQYLATGKPITGFGGRVMGAVEIMRDMKEIRKLARAVSQSEKVTFGDFIGKSPTVHQAVSFAQKIARTDSIISVRGESGTGKELFARAIHTESGRTGPFIPINCAALPETLLESELFGYVGGAFTGARKEGRPGIFETAGGGTILLDEIADMPLGPQAKILRAIQENRVRRIGSDREIPVDVRIITATNRNLEQMVEEGAFRRDLYYRINIFPIHLTPLKERPEDIPILVAHFLFQLAASLQKSVPSIKPEALNKLFRHDWPGNVRELKNVIERAALLCEGGPIEESCILFSFEIGRSIAGGGAAREPAAGSEPLAALLDGYERQIISRALSRGVSARQTARALGVSHTTLLNKVRKHGLKVAKK
ncbi:MAG: sigma 54-interacting transcriptional regulator [Thermodesulfobacteriota bacterium]